MAVFFRTNAYFQIKSNEEMTKPDSEEFLALEKLEIEGYEEAKRLRREILQEVCQLSNDPIHYVKSAPALQVPTYLPFFSTRNTPPSMINYSYFMGTWP